LSLNEEQLALRRRIAALAPAHLPKGIGRYSWVVLEYEMKGRARFSNRGQVSSYTGLCPGVHQSDGRGKEGAINRCGNRVVRWILIEMVWRLIRWQSHYGPIRALVEQIRSSKRSKKRLVVKAGAAFSHRFMALGHRANHGRKTGLGDGLGAGEKARFGKQELLPI
jgi:transposase